jgi:hypothetical protein
LCAREVDGRLANLREGMRRRGGGGRIGRNSIDQCRRVDRDRTSRHSQYTRQGDLRECQGLLGLNESCLSGGALRINP